MLPRSTLIFPVWLAVGVTTLAVLFAAFVGPDFLAGHWQYPATMVLGAFVAGSTPMGGGAVAFPVLSIFLEIDRTLARDFSLMIQSVGMTSASIFLLTRPSANLRDYRPLLWWVPVAFVGFAIGMVTLQGIRVPVIQAMFLSLTMAFAVAYCLSQHRGRGESLAIRGPMDVAMIALVLLLGGAVTSLFGTGVDILLYTLLVTRFRLSERRATELSVVLMASLSLLGFAWRAGVDRELTASEFRVWLCAAPVVLFMAPLGSKVLRQINAEWMLRAIAALGVSQMLYFNLQRPTVEKAMWSLGLSAVLLILFVVLLGRLSSLDRAKAAGDLIR